MRHISMRHISMRQIILLTSAFAIIGLLAFSTQIFSGLTRAEAGALRHTGMCDASAAVAIGPTLFVVANDEDNLLRVYRRDQAGEPVFSYDLSTFLPLDRKNPETDIEGAAQLGDLVFWISSHGVNKKGKRLISQHQLFATEIKVTGDKVHITPVGVPYQGLVDDLIRQPALQEHLSEAASRAPQEVNGLNIEGLSATPQGGLLIAFRNPIPNGKALLVPLQNPQGVIAGQAAQLGEPLLLPLQGLGIRSIDYFEATGKFLIVAGPYEDYGNFQLFEWTPPTAEGIGTVAGVNFNGMEPEAVAIYPDRKIQVLSDDGSMPVGGRECKHKKVRTDKKSFRSIWVNS